MHAAASDDFAAWKGIRTFRSMNPSQAARAGAVESDIKAASLHGPSSAYWNTWVKLHKAWFGKESEETISSLEHLKEVGGS